MNYILYSGYVLYFNKPDSSYRVLTRESFNIDSFEQMKNKGQIDDYIIDDIGVQITKKIPYE